MTPVLVILEPSHEYGRAAQRCDQLCDYAIRVPVLDLAGADRVMPAAAVLKHQATDISRGGAVGDAVATGDYRILVADASGREDAHICLRIECVERETVAGVDLLNGSQIEHHDGA